jgi:DNA-binding beta-propeller fold protein YncE
MTDDRLDSWKAIAAHLKRDVRTVRRWESHEGLPIHRHQHTKLATVYAYKSELDAWMHSRLPQADTPAARIRRSWLRIGGTVLLFLVVIAGALWIALRPPAARASAVQTIPSRLWTGVTGEEQSATLIRGTVGPLVMTADGEEVWVADWKASAIRIIDVQSARVTATVPVPGGVVLVAASEGGSMYVTAPSGDVFLVDRHTRAIERVIEKIDHLRAIAPTPDGRRLYLASPTAGLKVFDVATRELRDVSTVRCPVALAMEPRRNLLYVGYQCGGPGGRDGHDAIDIRALDTAEARGRIAGPPQVVDELFVAPNGTQLWVDGKDACANPDYDHVGCPIVPGGILNVFRVDDSILLRSVGTAAGNDPESLSFVPDGSRVIVGGAFGSVFDLTGLRIVEQAPWQIRGHTAFTADGKRMFASMEDAVAVIDLQSNTCGVPPPGLSAWWSGDGIPHDIRGSNSGEFRNGASAAPGWVGQALSFDGLDDYVDVPRLSNLDSGSPFTIAAWIKPSSSGREEVLLDNVSGRQAGWRLLRSSTGHVMFCHGSDGAPCTATSPWTVQTDAPVAADEWTHVAVVSGLDRFTTYVNGAEGATRSAAGRPFTQRQDLRIGRSSDGSRGFAGLLDEIQIFERALTREEALALHEAGRGGLCVR